MIRIKKIVVLVCVALMLSATLNSCKDKKDKEYVSTDSTSHDGVAVSDNTALAEQEAENYLPAFEEYVATDIAPSIAKMDDLMRLVKFPEIAKRAAIEGIVTVAVLIDKEGKPVKIQILQSANSHLNEPAITAVMKYDGYTPAEKNGEPVACWLVIPIDFKLKN